MSPADRVRALLGGWLAGVAGGLFGVGGGLILVPLLTAFFRLSQHEAHGTSLAVIGPTALAALLVYGHSSHVDWGMALLVALPSMWTARSGARWAARTSPSGLSRAFALLLVIVAVHLMWKAPVAAESPLLHGLPRVLFGLGLGAAVGMLSGYMGVGGGLIAVPGLTLGLGMVQQTAQGTSLAVILFTAPAGAAEHARHRHVVWPLVPALALGGMAGSPLTSWLAQRLPHELLVRIFALFLAANAAGLWARSRSARGMKPTV
ncbi:MAG TPA: sulfite exporter TauE/SafE family protein [Candidatus Eisenbacteria bacterium]|jgi:hypothetical protein